MKGLSGVLFALILVSQAGSQSRNLADAARDLARRILAISGTREPASVTVRALAPFGAADIAAARQALESALQARGVRLREAPAPVEISITLSENAEGPLLVAEIRRGDERAAVMAEWTRAPAPVAAPLLALDRRVLWEQEEPLLDFALLPDHHALALETGRVVLRTQANGGWQVTASVSFTAPEPWARDPRGRLLVTGETFQAWTPGGACRGAWQPALTLDCRGPEEPWPVAPGLRAPIAAGRNYFTGDAVSNPGARQSLPPFYSAAAAGGAWAIAALEGQTLLYTSAWERAGAIPNWGSDIAGIESGCGAGRQVLATRPGSASAPDAVAAYEIRGDAASAATAAMELSGPVTALWSAGSYAAAVVRDPGTGKYVAFRLAIYCGG